MTTSREMTTGPALPLILNFTLPLLLGNLLQQTYSLVDAAIVGQFLGIDALGGRRRQQFGDLPHPGILQRLLLRIRHSGGAALRRARLRPTCAATWPTPCGWPSASR